VRYFSILIQIWNQRLVSRVYLRQKAGLLRCEVMPGPNGRLIEDISAIRIALERFAAEQTDAAVRFHLACLEYRLASAAERYADPEFRSRLAADVDRLAAAVHKVR
jgi:hypothetical protein